MSPALACAFWFFMGVLTAVLAWMQVDVIRARRTRAAATPPPVDLLAEYARRRHPSGRP